MNWEQIILLYVTLIISLTVHEAAHALFAYLGGDRTAYYGGQMTLNPIPHMQREPFGMIMLPLMGLLMTGWCFGFAHAPIDPLWAERHPKKAALMSAAGPLSNLLLVAIAFVVLLLVERPDGSTQEAIHQIASVFLRLNLLLAVFNFIPLPPLDGAGIVSGLAPKARRLYDSLARIPFSGIFIFIGLIYMIPHLYLPVLRLIVGWMPPAVRIYFH